jgi:hypothetical protein
MLADTITEPTDIAEQAAFQYKGGSLRDVAPAAMYVSVQLHVCGHAVLGKSKQTSALQAQTAV